jgi:hypothetical protein
MFELFGVIQDNNKLIKQAARSSRNFLAKLTVKVTSQKAMTHQRNKVTKPRTADDSQ